FAPQEQVQATLAPYAERVSIAAVNGPENVVISGEETAVAAILDTLTARGLKSRRLTVSHAFHSPLMEPMLDEFERVAAGITYHAPQLSIISNVTGRLATAEQLTSPAYWREHVRQAVQFAAGMETLNE